MYSIAFKNISNVWYGIGLDDERKIIASSFSVKGRSDVVSSIIEHIPEGSDFIEIKPDKYVLTILEALSQIYEGRLLEFDFKLAMNRLPPFTCKVLMITFKIPKGFVATYGGIAKTAGNSQAARAVGNAEARNPFAPIIPCHRVISSTLGLGGYGGGLDVKRKFLEREGVIFDGDRVSGDCLWTPSEWVSEPDWLEIESSELSSN